MTPNDANFTREEHHGQDPPNSTQRVHLVIKIFKIKRRWHLKQDQAKTGKWKTFSQHEKGAANPQESHNKHHTPIPQAQTAFFYLLTPIREPIYFIIQLAQKVRSNNNPTNEREETSACHWRTDGVNCIYCKAETTFLLNTTEKANLIRAQGEREKCPAMSSYIYQFMCINFDLQKILCMNNLYIVNAKVLNNV